MNSMNDTGVVAGPASGQTSRTRRLRRVAVTGSIATLAAMTATTLAAALGQAAGVDFEVPDGGEPIPLPGVAVVTGVFSVVGVILAIALLRWSARPAERFVWTTVSLTVLSLVPPLLSGANAATTSALVGLHLIAAAVMIPTLARSLRIRPIDDRRRILAFADNARHGDAPWWVEDTCYGAEERNRASGRSTRRCDW